MKKIEFTPEEMSTIRLYMDGEIDLGKEKSNATPAQEKLLAGVLDRATSRLKEYPVGHDFGDDLIMWLWDEYIRQDYETNGIVMSEDELVVLKQHLNGEFGIFSANDYQKKHFSSVIDKAEALMQALNAYDEAGDDMIKWFWDKYRKQESANV